jgi:hypothetical protein
VHFDGWVDIVEHSPYPHHGREALAEVMIESLATKRLPRVNMRFAKDDFEGRSDWVPRQG